jgi:hypothetical protein
MYTYARVNLCVCVCERERERERERVFCVPLLPTVILSKIQTFSIQILLEPNSENACIFTLQCWSRCSVPTYRSLIFHMLPALIHRIVVIAFRGVINLN